MEKDLNEETKQRYKLRIETIKSYYSISDEASVYIYFRRKRSYPWRKKTDPKYLFWNAKLQNALIHVDSIIGFVWAGLEYGKEEEALLLYGIDMENQSQNLYRGSNQSVEKTFKKNQETYIDENGDAWTIIKSNKNDKPPANIAAKEYILRSIGLLPKLK